MTEITARPGIVIRTFIRFVQRLYPNIFERITDIAIYVLRSATREGRHNFLNYGISNVPLKIEGFHDLCWLFSCSPANRGIIALDLDEAAYLHKLCVGLSEGACVVEIGRYLGGSTFLLASALPKGGSLISIDNKRRKSKYVDVNDNILSTALDRAGLRDKVELVIADSSSFVPSKNSQFDLVFIDGDHSYEGAKNDYEHWSPMAKKGGYIIFHDAGASRRHVTKFGEVEKLIREIQYSKKSGLTYLTTIGSMVSFMKDKSLF